MTSDELKQALSEDNNYDYIYLVNDITETSGFFINSNNQKEYITERHDIPHKVFSLR